MTSISAIYTETLAMNLEITAGKNTKTLCTIVSSDPVRKNEPDCRKIAPYTHDIQYHMLATFVAFTLHGEDSEASTQARGTELKHTHFTQTLPPPSHSLSAI